MRRTRETPLCRRRLANYPGRAPKQKVNNGVRIRRWICPWAIVFLQLTLIIVEHQAWRRTPWITFEWQYELWLLRPLRGITESVCRHKHTRIMVRRKTLHNVFNGVCRWQNIKSERTLRHFCPFENMIASKTIVLPWYHYKNMVILWYFDISHDQLYFYCALTQYR